MNRFLSIFALLGVVSAYGGSNQPVSVPVSLQGVYAVEGFDDNDRVQVTVHGILPTTCYKVSKSEAKLDTFKNVIRLAQTAFFYESDCLRIPSPFTDVVNVGILEAGKYSLVDDRTGKALGELTIAQANRPEADDFLYAGVEDAYITSEGSYNDLVLVGKFLDSCTQYQESKINYTKNSIIVQPIAKRDTSLGNCQAGEYPFTRSISIPGSINGKYLLHVRAMNGQAINKVVHLR